MATKFLNTIKFPGLDDTYIVNDLSVIAPDYDDTKEYKIGNLLTYLGKQYYCIADAPAGTLPTNTSYFEEKSVSDIIEMIKQGAIVTAHSQVADNLTPYSEDSGTTQENPFISQGTGTDNNSVIVTTGAIARQLEKQGNTPVVNQHLPELESAKWDFQGSTGSISNGVATFTADSQYGNIIPKTQYRKIPVIQGHKYLVTADINNASATTNVLLRLEYGSIREIRGCLAVTGWQTVSFVYTATASSNDGYVYVYDYRASDWAQISVKNVYCIDLTQWGFSADIITDLTSHPEHFSWYYNGSLAYDAGSLQNCNGRYLECGQGRQLWDEEWEQGIYNQETGEKESSTSIAIRSKNKILITPNCQYYAFAPSTIRVFFYDRNEQYLGTTTADGVFIAPSNAIFMTFQFGGVSTYSNNITISKYYSPEEGGEGYNQHYDYVAPIRIDTGNEPLYASGSRRDTKLPSGLITHKVHRQTITISSIYQRAGNESCDFAVFALDYPWASNAIYPVFDKYIPASSKGFDSETTAGLWLVYSTDNKQLCISVPKGTTKAQAEALYNGMYIHYNLATATEEQGTPFSEYAPINDYSYMAWFDTDGNLVSIPQGCKLFYPVDYKGFTDDLVMYTNGDATALAKNESITDAALNARGYYKMQDLSSDVTLATGVTAILKKAYKHGNVMTMSLVLQNTSGAELASYATLFTLASGMFPANQYIVAYVEANNLLKRFRINPSGEGGIEYALPNSGVVYINISYAVA